MKKQNDTEEENGNKSHPILTARICSSNAEQFPDILKLHVPTGTRVLDMTYGKGVFWKNVRPEEYDVWENDLAHGRGVFGYDFRFLPEAWEDSFGACVLDPPYLGVGGIKTLKHSIDRGYLNKERASKSKQGGISGVRRLYASGISEAWRVLKRSGILIIKTMDQVESGQQNFLSHDVMELCRILGFKVIDEFIYVNKNTPTMRHKTQKHARRNHSSWIVSKRRP